MNTCPCCSSILLRHLNSQKVTWFCLQCRQEMPIVNLNNQYLYVDLMLNKQPQQHRNSVGNGLKSKPSQ